MENKSGTHPLGIVTREAEGFQVVFERHLSHPAQTVWEAITDPEQLKIWFTDFEMDFREGGKVTIFFRDKDRSVTHGEIVKIDPPRCFAWTWEGELGVWEIEPTSPNSCRLRLTYSKMADQYAVGAAGGFHSLLDRLEWALDGKTETYPFGTEEHDPEQALLRESYGNLVYDCYPELEVYHPVQLERVYNTTIERVWNALTMEEQTKQWYFDFNGNFSLEPGHQFDWWAGPEEGQRWLHRGMIEEVIPLQKLSHTWEYPGYSGKGRVTWELQAINSGQTKLKLIYDILEVFDPTEEALRRKNFLAGWKQLMLVELTTFLEQ